MSCFNQLDLEWLIVREKRLRYAKSSSFEEMGKSQLPEREHFSDQDSEDESEEYISDEEIVIPKRKQKNKPKPKLKRKRKSKPKPKSAKKKKLRIPKKQSGVSREPVPVSG